MPKKKAAVNCKVPFWLSARADCKEGRFIQVGNSLLLSKKFQELSFSSQVLYLYMAMEAAGRREFTFTKSAGKKYGMNESTLRRSITELERNGLIEKTLCGRITREANQYSFCYAWKEQRPP